MPVISLISDFFRPLFRIFLDFLFPKRCVGCNIEGSYLCTDCFVKIPLLKKQYCPFCRIPSIGGKTCPRQCSPHYSPQSPVSDLDRNIYSSRTPSRKIDDFPPVTNHLWRKRYSNGNADRLFISLAAERTIVHYAFQRILTKHRASTFPLDALIVGMVYEPHHLLPKALYRFKYHFDESLGETLAQILVTQFRNHFHEQYLLEPWIIVPVPLHPKREQARGFNQSAILASYVCKAVSLPFVDALIRIKYTKSQAQLSRNERLSNMQNTFDIAHNVFVSEYNVLLIDDVCTTGATLIECARVLKENGAKRVTGMVLGRGI